MEVEDEIEFADISKVFVEDLHKALHEFQNNQLIMILIHDGYEVKTGVALIYYLVFLVI